MELTEMQDLTEIRDLIQNAHRGDERKLIAGLIEEAEISAEVRNSIAADAAKLVSAIRTDEDPGLMEIFLAEYGLSTDEGVALMCLAEALLRVPDPETMDDLIEDKIAPSAWGAHLGHSSSSLVNASTWALKLTGKVLDEDDTDTNAIARTLHGAVKRLGEPVIRRAVARAMKEMGNQFVLGETIDEAVRRGQKWESKGYTYSYDMLGEAALTAGDANEYFNAYKDAIEKLSGHCKSSDIRENPGISIKLSALHPRYELPKATRVLTELVETVKLLAIQAKNANMGLNIDAEEADRLDISMDVIEKVFSDSALDGWDGFGVVVQAYGKRAARVLDWLYALAAKYDRKIMVRLVKGAYWDTEVKRAQIDGVPDFPVFTRKSATDVSYICCAKKLLGMTDRIYPQFATHNAHTVTAINHMADDQPYEFQRLHGMGEAMHKIVMENTNTRCRIYAPVGAHEDLLAYLVRRLLENGANSSFVNQIVDETVSPEEIAADPFVTWDAERGENNPAISKPADIYQPERPNSKGWDLRDRKDLAEIEAARTPFQNHKWDVAPIMAVNGAFGDPVTIINPAKPDDVVGTVQSATADDVAAAIDAASNWADTSGEERARILNLAADLYEENFGEIFAALTREAGKSVLDAVAEIREAVDFLRYYAAEIERLDGAAPRGIFACISPWNFPLAIFTGQISAALAAGNGVLAKPAEQTPIMATIGVRLMHEAGVPKNVLQLLPGDGATVGAALSSDSRIDGMCFTGSTATAQRINRTMARNAAVDAPLIAETGGLNAMIVDSTALPEQAVRDIVQSSFQSAGQRCSALRVLYLQEDIAEPFLKMLYGAIDELAIGDPWDFATDVGPVIDATAKEKIAEYIDQAANEGRLMKRIKAPKEGTFIPPSVIRVKGIGDMAEEIFGPVLHVATFKANDIDQILADINASGYGLTFGLHTRIDDRVEHVTSNLNVGNIYINRNQIGAVVGSQPFGGEGMSGTGPKAGGPHYVKQFTRRPSANSLSATKGQAAPLSDVQAAIDALHKGSQGKILAAAELPGPTGESNRLSTFGKGVILCLGPSAEAADVQATAAESVNCQALRIAPGVSGDHAIDGTFDPALIADLDGFDAVVLWSDGDDARAIRTALADREGMLIPLIQTADVAAVCIKERHICIDTTAAGGNASLLAASA
jgi:RHH-type proline utilization regulon transcriptional repressor/proline dehydrogenase/delta 1-pyrroline-5-carboxylate dehydrogenase